MRQLAFENDVLRAVSKVFRPRAPSPMMNGKKALVTDKLRATKVRGPEGTRRFLGDIKELL